MDVVAKNEMLSFKTIRLSIYFLISPINQALLLNILGKARSIDFRSNDAFLIQWQSGLYDFALSRSRNRSKMMVGVTLNYTTRYFYICVVFLSRHVFDTRLRSSKVV